MRRFLCAIAIGLISLVGCNSAENTRLEEVRGKLVGTWLTVSDSGAAKSRRVLVLANDGKFTDRIASTSAEGSTERVEYGGDWSYDGINLKCKFLQENGRHFSGSTFRYTTFPLISVSASELVVDDNIRKIKVVFQRVSEGTMP